MVFSINLNEPIKILWNKVTKSEEKKELKELIFKIRTTLQSAVTQIELCKYKFGHFNYSQLELVLSDTAIKLDELSSFLTSKLSFENSKFIYNSLQELISQIKSIVQDLKLKTMGKSYLEDILSLIKELKKSITGIDEILSK